MKIQPFGSDGTDLTMLDFLTIIGQEEQSSYLHFLTFHVRFSIFHYPTFTRSTHTLSLMKAKASLKIFSLPRQLALILVTTK